MFVILPPRSIGVAELIQPYGLALFALVALAGGAWVSLGGAVHAGSRGRGGFAIRRTSSVVVVLFSALILASVLAPPASSAALVHATDRP